MLHLHNRFARRLAVDEDVDSLAAGRLVVPQVKGLLDAGERVDVPAGAMRERMREGLTRAIRLVVSLRYHVRSIYEPCDKGRRGVAPARADCGEWLRRTFADHLGALLEEGAHVHVSAGLCAVDLGALSVHFEEVEALTGT